MKLTIEYQTLVVKHWYLFRNIKFQNAIFAISLFMIMIFMKTSKSENSMVKENYKRLSNQISLAFLK